MFVLLVLTLRSACRQHRPSEGADSLRDAACVDITLAMAEAAFF